MAKDRIYDCRRCLWWTTHRPLWALTWPDFQKTFCLKGEMATGPTVMNCDDFKEERKSTHA